MENAVYPDLLSVKEVAEILKVAPETVRRYYMKRKENPLPGIKISRNKYRISKKDFMEWIKSMPDPRENI